MTSTTAISSINLGGGRGSAIVLSPIIYVPSMEHYIDFVRFFLQNIMLTFVIDSILQILISWRDQVLFPVLGWYAFCIFIEWHFKSFHWVKLLLVHGVVVFVIGFQAIHLELASIYDMHDVGVLHFYLWGGRPFALECCGCTAARTQQDQPARVYDKTCVVIYVVFSFCSLSCAIHVLYHIYCLFFTYFIHCGKSRTLLKIYG